MSQEHVDLNRLMLALERATGDIFEKFALVFYAAEFADTFVPLGGLHDGGADAFLEPIYESSRKANTFFQASVTSDHKGKIRSTVKRLKEFSRMPKSLYYLTSRKIQYIDQVAETLSEEVDINIRIRDADWIASRINSSVQTRAAYFTYLEPLLSFLSAIGNTTLQPVGDYSASPAVYVFLRQELERREGKDDLVHALADGLILWALEGTDPDKGILMSSSDILTKIQKVVPTAKNMLKGVVPNRLSTLSKVPKLRRYVKYHTRYKKYCLSYELRKHVEQENLDDEALRLRVLESFITRIDSEYGKKLKPDEIENVARMSFEVVQKAFERNGVEFAAFLQGQPDNRQNVVISDIVDELFLEKGIPQDQFALTKEAILENFRGAFYNSTKEERLLFSKLCLTYTLLFCLNHEPKVVEYFQHMAADFYLYVGSDILVRALSERYLKPADQMIRNILNLIKQAGGKLILADPVLAEVHHHIKGSDYEYQNHFHNVDDIVTSVIARQSSKILVRSYYYAKTQPPEGIKPPNNWPAFINQFCDYTVLHSEEGRDQVRIYLMNQFHMEYESPDEINKLVDSIEANVLASKLQPDKKTPLLALHDVQMALLVYGQRKRRREIRGVSEFGFRTWWLTGESTILRHTEDLMKREGSRYMMRPEFLVSFLALAPTMAEVRATYREVFPSLLGLNLARRISQQELDNILSKVEEAKELEPGRRAAVIAKLSDQLKSGYYAPPPLISGNRKEKTKPSIPQEVKKVSNRSGRSRRYRAI